MLIFNQNTPCNSGQNDNTQDNNTTMVCISEPIFSPQQGAPKDACFTIGVAWRRSTIGVGRRRSTIGVA